MNKRINIYVDFAASAGIRLFLGEWPLMLICHIFILLSSLKFQYLDTETEQSGGSNFGIQINFINLFFICSNELSDIWREKVMAVWISVGMSAFRQTAGFFLFFFNDCWWVARRVADLTNFNFFPALFKTRFLLKVFSKLLVKDRLLLSSQSQQKGTHRGKQTVQGLHHELYN